MTETKQTADGAAQLAERLTGPVLAAGDPGYEEARAIFNARIASHPRAIARCADVEDVRAALVWAREAGWPVSVRAGGHAVHGLAIRDGGVVIDIRSLDEVRVDPEQRTARVGGGARWRQVYEAAAVHGLAPTGGTETSVGVVGFITGSGNAWLMRRHGLACDSVLAFEVVTADGAVVEVDASSDPELFWALKGGGGNFGVVTAVTIRLHTVPAQMVAGVTYFAAEDAAATLAGYRDAMEAASRDTHAMWAMAPLPDVEDLPPVLRGRTVVLLAMLHTGTPAEGARELEPLRRLATPLLDTVAEVPFAQGIRILDGVAPAGLHNHWRGAYLHRLEDEAIETALPLATAEPEIGLQVWRMGGAVDDVAPEEAAIPRAGRRYFLGFASAWVDPAATERVVHATDAAADAFGPWTSGVCPNHVDRLGADELREAFGEEIHDRLRAVKRRLDPDNVFSANQNIEP